MPRSSTVNDDSQTQSMPSSASTIRVSTFQDECAISAGEPLAHIPYQDPYKVKCASYDAEPEGSGESQYYPFNNRSDFALAEWFFRYKVSKGGVDDFTKNPRLKCWLQHCSFDNAEQWRAKIHDIPWGIQDDQFTAKKIIVGLDVAKIKEFEIVIYARDVIMCIKFLLGHGPFKNNLTYAPEQHYRSDSEIRVYNEMHTGDWWWSQQQSLPAGATIVPLLMATDKTVLTLHHGDLSLWPVYLTIGNLDTATRKRFQLSNLEKNTTKI